MPTTKLEEEAINQALAGNFQMAKNINLEMVRHGLAQVHRQYLPQGFDIEPYLKAETEARKMKKGMWILGDKYIGPEQWRKVQKGN